MSEAAVRESEDRAKGLDQAPFGDLARQVARLVGDGCLIRRLVPEAGALETVATHHHDPGLIPILESAPTPDQGGWLAQALERDCVLRLPLEPEELKRVGIPAELLLEDAIVVPIKAAGLVIVALRGPAGPRYSFADRLALERIAASFGDQLASRPGPAQGGQPPSGSTEAANCRSDPAHLVDLAPVGLWLIHRSGRTAWVNETASELVGIPARKLIGAAVPEFVAGGEGGLGEGLHAEQSVDRKLIRPDGNEIWLSAATRPLFDRGGEPAGTLLTFVDIDERKRREVDLRIRLQTTQALVSVAELSLDAPDLKAILGESVRVLAEQLDAVLATVSSIDLQRRELRVLAVAGNGDPGWIDEMRRGLPIRLREPSLALAALERSTPVVIEDFGGDPAYPTLAAHGIRSGVFVPLGDGQSVLSTLSREPGGIGSAALPLVESVARMIASYQGLVGELRRRGCSDSPPGISGFLTPESGGCELSPPRRHRWRRRPGLA